MSCWWPKEKKSIYNFILGKFQRTEFGGFMNTIMSVQLDFIEKHRSFSGSRWDLSIILRGKEKEMETVARVQFRDRISTYVYFFSLPSAQTWGKLNWQAVPFPSVTFSSNVWEHSRATWKKTNPTHCHPGESCIFLDLGGALQEFSLSAWAIPASQMTAGT